MQNIRDLFLRSSRIIFDTLFFLLSILILIMPALENGFPILHSDSGSYLLMGFGDKIPVSRPITYCLFVRFSSLQYSVWFTVAFQAFIVAWIILNMFKLIMPGKHASLFSFIAITILSITTGLSHYVSQIMPDIFIPTALLGFFILLIDKNASIIKLVLICLVTFLSSIMHMSNLPVLTGTLAAVAFLALVWKRRLSVVLNRQTLLATVILLLSWVSIPMINYAYKDGFRFSNSSSIVFFSRLLECGAAQTYIQEKCETDSTMSYCKYKDEVANYQHFEQFLWDNKSFLYDKDVCGKVTWDNCWKLRNAEFGQLNKEILAYDKSKKQFITAVISDFFEQTGSFRLKFFTSFKEGSHIDMPIKKYFPHDRKAFLSANQYTGTLKYDYISDIQFITIIISLMIILVFLFSKQKDPAFKAITGNLFAIVILSILVSSFITAVFAVVSGRFTGRLIWIVPLIAIIIGIEKYRRMIETPK